MIVGLLLLTIFLFVFSPSFESWLRSFPMPDGTESGKLMPGILAWFFAGFVIADILIFIIWLWNF